MEDSNIIDIYNLDPNKTYWFFDIAFSGNGRVSRKCNICEVKLKIQRKGNYPVLENIKTKDEIWIYWCNYSNLCKTKEEAIVEWNRTINNKMDEMNSKYFKIIQNIKKHFIQNK